MPDPFADDPLIAHFDQLLSTIRIASMHLADHPIERVGRYTGADLRTELRHAAARLATVEAELTRWEKAEQLKHLESVYP